MPALGERIVLKDLTCPLVRLDKSRRRDKSLSFSISLGLHALIFILVGISVVKSPQFGVDRGLGSIDVNLIADTAENSVSAPVETITEIKSDFVQKEEVKAIVQKDSSGLTKGKDQVTVQSSAGALTEAKPNYLNNPAPVYPDSARRRGHEGTVLLTVFVDKNGHAVRVEIEKSSGHSVLDEVALKAVKKWQFRPAMLGSIPIESSVRVPIRFDLVVY